MTWHPRRPCLGDAVWAAILLVTGVICFVILIAR